MIRVDFRSLAKRVRSLVDAARGIQPSSKASRPIAGGSLSMGERRLMRIPIVSGRQPGLIRQLPT